MTDWRLSLRAQEYLEQLQVIEDEISSLSRQLNKWYEAARKTTSLTDRIKVSGTSNAKKLEDACIGEQELMDELADKLRGKTILYQEITSTIGSLANPKHRKLLTLQYIEGLKGRALAEKMGFDDRHVRRIAREALASFNVPEKYLVLQSKDAKIS